MKSQLSKILFYIKDKIELVLFCIAFVCLLIFEYIKLAIVYLWIKTQKSLIIERNYFDLLTNGLYRHDTLMFMDSFVVEKHDIEHVFLYKFYCLETMSQELITHEIIWKNFIWKKKNSSFKVVK